MTTFAYKLTLNDSEAFMLKGALELMIKHCDEHMVGGPCAPYWANKDSAKNVLKRLFADTHQTSGNDFTSGGNTIFIKG